jgi:hypothetical protein
MQAEAAEMEGLPQRLTRHLPPAWMALGGQCEIRFRKIGAFSGGSFDGSQARNPGSILPLSGAQTVQISLH